MIQIQISTQPTRLETSTQPAALNMQSQGAQLDITTAAATVEISQSQGTLTIDSYPCRAAIGLLNATDMIGNFAQMGLQAAQELTAQYVQDGNRLADITSGASTVAQLADEHTTPQSLDINLAPVPLPDISYRMTPAQISWNPAQIHFQTQPSRLQGDYTPGNVDTRVSQYASIDIQVTDTGNNVNLRT